MYNQKICSFHVSDLHLFTVVLPYINEKIKEEKDIVIISQKDLSLEVKKYLKNVKSFECEREKIISIGWRRVKEEQFDKDFSEKTVIVIGNNDFIDEVNKFLDTKIGIYEIVNCYNVESGNQIASIVEKYDMFLNTEGKFRIEKNSQNAQKRKTIKSQL